MRTIAVAAALMLTGCPTDPAAARRTLDDSGYTDIQTGDYAYWQCGKDDWSHTSFTAKNPAGKVVHGTVCCGLWTKGCTIRF